MIPKFSPILAALAHIEAHLCDKLTMQDLADVSGYSLFHFTRLFNQYLGLTPYDYLIRRRLSDASEALLTSDKRIIDIAQDYQFGSHETFTRAFNRLFSMTPSQWREQGSHRQNLLLPPLGEDYLFVLNEIIDRKPTVITLESFRLLGWTLLEENDQNLTGLWQSLSRVIPDDDITHRWIVRVTSEKPGIPDLQFFGVNSALKGNSTQLLASYSVEAGEYLKIALNQKGKLAHISSVLIFLYHALMPKIKYKIIPPIILICLTEQLEVLIPVEPLSKAVSDLKSTRHMQ
jgi:AraC family transcriptional regulator